MALTNEIVLRPRFKFTVNHDNENILKLFEDTKKKQSDFVLTRVDDHVFIKIPKAKQHFWSPQLHLEITKDETPGKSIIYGLFGPWPQLVYFRRRLRLLPCQWHSQGGSDTAFGGHVCSGCRGIVHGHQTGFPKKLAENGFQSSARVRGQDTVL